MFLQFGGRVIEYYGKEHDRVINLLKVKVFDIADKDKFIAKRAWNKAWKDLKVDTWGNAQDWTDYQLDYLITQASKYIPEKFDKGNLFDNIREVFGDFIVKPNQEKTKE